MNEQERVRRVDLEQLRRDWQGAQRPGSDHPRWVKLDRDELAALLAVVDAARGVERVYGFADDNALYLALEPLLDALEPFAPAEEHGSCRSGWALMAEPDGKPWVEVPRSTVDALERSQLAARLVAESPPAAPSAGPVTAVSDAVCSATGGRPSPTQAPPQASPPGSALSPSCPHLSHGAFTLCEAELALRRIAEVERERDEAVMERRAAENWANTMEHERDWETQVVHSELLDRADTAEARLARAPALVEALRETLVRLGDLTRPPFVPGYTHLVADERDRLRAALAAWEAE